MEPIGIRTIQSILMNATQTSLSHFHTAGMLEEHGTLVKPSVADAMDSYYTNKNTSMIFDVQVDDVSEIRGRLAHAKLDDFVYMVRSSFTVLPERENIWYEALGRPMSRGNVLRLYVDFEKLRHHGITLKELAYDSFGADCEWETSPDFMGMIDVNFTGNYVAQWLSRLKTKVCGTPEIVSCELTGDHTMSTLGSNILAASKDLEVCSETITSNNVNDVEKCFGIEAAASVLCELTGSHVVSDFMTRTGRVLPFSKSSQEVSAKGLLASMGFERPKNDIRRELIRGGTTGSSIYDSIMTGTTNS